MVRIEKARPKVVAAIPCFNTEPSVAAVVARARKHVDQSNVYTAEDVFKYLGYLGYLRAGYRHHRVNHLPIQELCKLS